MVGRLCFSSLVPTLVLPFLPADGAVGGVDGPTQSSEEQLEEPVVKKQRTEGYGEKYFIVMNVVLYLTCYPVTYSMPQKFEL